MPIRLSLTYLARVVLDMCMRQIVIGFGCKRRRGKDVAAAFAAARLRQHGLPCRVDYFAHSIKEGIGKGVFGFSDAQLYGELKELPDPFWGWTPREVFQRFGSDAMHTLFGKDIWIRTLLRRLEANLQTHVVVADVRFRHEFDALRQLGGHLVRVDRHIADAGDEDRHLSEVDLDGCDTWDACIDNNGSLDALQQAVETFVDRLL